MNSCRFCENYGFLKAFSAVHSGRAPSLPSDPVARKVCWVVSTTKFELKACPSVSITETIGVGTTDILLLCVNQTDVDMLMRIHMIV